MKPPRAAAQPHELVHLGHKRIDPYYWLRERQSPEVRAYLEAENAYTESQTAHTRELEDSLFEEIKGRIKQDDQSVPYRLDDYFYYTRFEEGRQYPVHCRKLGSVEAEEEVLLDVNAMAEGHTFYNLGRRAVSQGQDLLAFSVDTVGRRIYTIEFKNLADGSPIEDRIPEVTGAMAWANDNRTLFYTKQDPTTLRSYQVYRHELGTDVADDVLVYEEQDETFNLHVWRTKSKRFMVIGSFQTLTSECRILDADDPTGEFRVVQPRERGHEYSVDHYRDHLYIRTNDCGRNFRLARAPIDRTERSHWEEVLAHREEVLFEGFEIFRDHLVLEERREGLIRLRVRPWSGDAEHEIEFDEPAYLAYIGTNFQFDTDIVRYGYSSLTTPDSVYDYNMVTREKTLMKRREILGNFDREDYEAERLMVPARDGKRVPVSMVYRRDAARDGSRPLLLYGYGAYGYSLDASFSPAVLSLLDRGFTYAIAHVRGGEDLGRGWYEDGRQLNKKNSFTDFIDCGEYLIEHGHAHSEQLYAMGGSAGGLLMGAVMNMRPDLFHGVVATVPFVDVVTTMLDESLPLTTGEYDEWGDPNEKQFYDYILSYSPYDNIAAVDYPHLLVMTGLHDSQVQYWEPAKWVAALRASKTDANRLLFKTNLEAGHGGASGRFRRYRETAFKYAFLLDLAGLG